MWSSIAVIALSASAANAAFGCSEDNCYRNFVNNCGAASSFCANFTTAMTTTLTATPTYFRPECTVSRLSSACSCVFPKTLAPTQTEPPCYPVPCPPGRQYVKDGDFNEETSYVLPAPPPPPVPQWDIATSSSNFTIYRGRSTCHPEGDYFTQLQAQQVPTIGWGSITQNLTKICGGKSYNISGYISTGSDPTYNKSSSLSVYFDGAKVYGPQAVCSAANPCPVTYDPCNPYPWKGRYFSIIAPAAHASPNLTIRVDYVDNGGAAWATWLDNVTVVGV